MKRTGSPARWRARSSSMNFMAGTMSLVSKGSAFGTATAFSIMVQYTMYIAFSSFVGYLPAFSHGAHIFPRMS
jgi:hypothetical protein